MSIMIGNVTVPTPAAPSTTFPLVPDFGCSTMQNPNVAIHRFGSADAKIEQRFYLGPGIQTYTFKKNTLSLAEKNALETFFIDNQGLVGQFFYNAPNQDGTTTTVVVKFAADNMTFESTAGAITSSVGLTFIGVPGAGPTYSISSTVTRFPSSALETALLSQQATIIPLLIITTTAVANSGYPVIYLSDRSVTIGGQFYAPRLLTHSGIAQTIDGSSDQVTFTLANADRVMTAVVNQVGFDRARVQFLAYHVDSGILMQVWAGNVITPGGWSFDTGPMFYLNCSDPASALNLVYPQRQIDRTCWKVYNDGLHCPWASASGVTYTSRTVPAYGSTETFTFAPSPTSCDFGWSTPNGCLSHGMENYYGGIIINPQTVVTKDNSTGFFGIGRASLTTASQVADSAWGNPLPAVFCNLSSYYENIGFIINAIIGAGRDEGDYYAALAVCCEGPIGEFAVQDSSLAPHQLDYQPPIGWPNNLQGLRLSVGADPTTDEFSLDQVEPAGTSTTDFIKAAGVAWCQIRRTDAKGLQPTDPTTHTMQVSIKQGLSCWEWTAPGTSALIAGESNPFWICANIWLKANGVFNASDSVRETYIDVASFIAAAAVANTSVPVLVGTGTEIQYQFCGILSQARSVRDQFQQVLNNALGYFNWSYGKLRVGIRDDSDPIQAFNSSNICFETLKLQPSSPRFNRLTANFADIDYQFQNNVVVDKCVTHAQLIGSGGQPLYLDSQINLNGTYTLSQTVRLVSTRLAEEVGGNGVNIVEEFAYARQGSFRTTILALATEAGQIISLGSSDTMLDLPNYPATDPSNPDPMAATPYYMEARIQKWQLNPDWSLDITLKSTHKDMYSLIVGPHPAEVIGPTPPTESYYAPSGFSFGLTVPGDGTISLQNFVIGEYGASVAQGIFGIYYIDESVQSIVQAPAINAAGSSGTSFALNTELSPLPRLGQYLLIDQELMFVIGVAPGTSTVTVVRGALGTTAVTHAGPITGTELAIPSAANPCQFTIGTGLAIQPGYQAVVVTNPGGATLQAGVDAAFVASYNPATGVIVTTLPLAIAISTTGSVMAFFPPVSYVTLKQFQVPFPPNYFATGGQAFFNYSIDLPSAGVVAVNGYVINQSGLISNTAMNTYATGAFPYRLRTGASKVLSMVHPALPSGTTTNVFQSLSPTVAQSVLQVLAQIVGQGGPIAPPRAPSQVQLSGTAAQVSGGIPVGSSLTITISGTIDSTGIIVVNVSGANVNLQSGQWIAASEGITSSSTAAQVAASLAHFLQNGPASAYSQGAFNTYFYTYATGAVVTMVDLQGLVAHLTVGYQGNLTVAWTTLAQNILNVVTGRSYAIAYADTSGPYLSELSPTSASSGPTAAYGSIVISDIPASPDSRVNQINVYGYPDGVTTGMPRLVGTVANPGSGTGLVMFTDTTTEATLATNALYPGPTQPTAPGTVTISLFTDGTPWVDIFIPATASQAMVNGICLYSLPAGCIITANVVNNGGTASLSLSIS
jgi:hypothetical protein